MRAHVPPDPTPPPAQVPSGAADIACDVAARRLWDYVDGRLPDLLRAELDAHLATCAACPTHVAFARATRRALADAGAGGLSDARHAALRARLRVALDGARGQHAGGEPPHTAESRHA